MCLFEHKLIDLSNYCRYKISKWCISFGRTCILLVYNIDAVPIRSCFQEMWIWIHCIYIEKKLEWRKRKYGISHSIYLIIIETEKTNFQFSFCALVLCVRVIIGFGTYQIFFYHFLLWNIYRFMGLLNQSECILPYFVLNSSDFLVFYRQWGP